MSLDPRKLDAFVMADDLVVEVYGATKAFSVEERFGLQAQLRRVPSQWLRSSSRARPVGPSVTTCTSSRSPSGPPRRCTIGSASEVRYLLGLAVRLGFIPARDGGRLTERYDRVVRALQALVSALGS